jgi:hypothetical protein
MKEAQAQAPGTRLLFELEPKLKSWKKNYTTSSSSLSKQVDFSFLLKTWQVGLTLQAIDSSWLVVKLCAYIHYPI